MAGLILHEDPISANCYKVRLTAALLDVPLERRTYSTVNGDTRTQEFLQHVSHYGRIPVLQIDDSHYLPESNAACFYVAERAASTGPRRLIPADPLDRAEMLRWMFFEQNQHEVNIATLRFWLHIIGRENLDDGRLSQIEGKRVASRQVLDCMDAHLAASRHGWFVGDAISLADICLFAYTQFVHLIQFDLADWPAVQKWCGEVQAVPNFIPMD